MTYSADLAAARTATAHALTASHEASLSPAHADAAIAAHGVAHAAWETVASHHPDHTPVGAAAAAVVALHHAGAYADTCGAMVAASIAAHVMSVRLL